MAIVMVPMVIEFLFDEDVDALGLGLGIRLVVIGLFQCSFTQNCTKLFGKGRYSRYLKTLCGEKCDRPTT